MLRAATGSTSLIGIADLLIVTDAQCLATRPSRGTAYQSIYCSQVRLIAPPSPSIRSMQMRVGMRFARLVNVPVRANELGAFEQL